MVYSISFVMPYYQWPSEEFLDGNPIEIELAGPETKEKRRLQIINKTHRYHLGMPIADDHVPTIWQWSSSKALLDFDNPHAFPCVNAKIKSIIEELEPDVHQFFPVQVVGKKKEPLDERWLWNVCNRIDSVDREHTTWIQPRGKRWFHPDRVRPEDLPEDYDRSVPPKIVFSTERIGSAHFWRDPNLKRRDLYCSQSAGDALLSEAFTGLELAKWESV